MMPKEEVRIIYIFPQSRRNTAIRFYFFSNFQFSFSIYKFLHICTVQYMHVKIYPCESKTFGSADYHTRVVPCSNTGTEIEYRLQVDKHAWELLFSFYLFCRNQILMLSRKIRSGLLTLPLKYQKLNYPMLAYFKRYQRRKMVLLGFIHLGRGLNFFGNSYLMI